MPIGEPHSAALNPGSAELLERHAELAAVAAAGTDAASGTGRLVVVVGPAGIGKTALLRAAREHAVAAGLEVLRARGAEFERDAGFGVARQLFADDAVLSGGAAGRGRQALADAVHGLYRLTVDRASRGPVALIVDDAHWSDVPSLRFLAYLATRLEDLPVLVVVAMRPPDHEPLTSALAAAPDAIVLRPGRLSERATAQLVRRALPDAGHELCVACHDATGGNPFFVGEVAATLRSSGATDPDDVRELVPPTVADAVAARIATLPEAARALAHATAVLGDGVLTRHAGAVAGLDLDAAGEAADALTAAGIVEPRRPLAFAHPIVRAAVYADMPPGRRARAHGRAARLLDEEGAPAEQVAAQLLGTEPRGDAWTCEQLIAIGRREAARGAADAAAAAFRRALAEPPPAARQPGLLFELGVAELMALQLEPATAHLRAALAAADDPDLRLDAGLALASVLGGTQRPADGVDVLEQALLDSPGASRDRIGEAEGELVNIARLHGPSRRRVAGRSARMRRRVDAGDPVGTAELAAVAADMTMAGESAERSAALALRAIRALSTPSRSAFASDLAVPQAVRCLTVADRFDEAEAVLDAALAAAAATGSEGPTMLAMRTESLLRRGALNAALTAGRRALELAEHGWQVGVPGSAALLAQVHLERGDPDAALAVLGRPGVETTGAYTTIMAVHARGCVRLALGDAEAAAADLLRCGPLLADAGSRTRRSSTGARRRPWLSPPRGITSRHCGWRTRSSTSHGSSARRARSGWRCGRGPPWWAGTPRWTTCATPPRCLPDRRPSSRGPRCSPTWARRCWPPAGPATPGPRSPTPPSSPTAARRPRSAPASCRRCTAPARGRDASSAAVPARSPRPSGGWRRWPRRAWPTATSRRSLSSPPAPWSSISAPRIASSA